MVVELAEFLSGCPFLDGTAVKVNYLAETPGAYSLMKSGERTEKKRYADGGTVHGQGFVLAMRGECTAAGLVNAATAKKCSAVEQWIQQQSIERAAAELNIPGQILELKLVKGFVPVRTGSVSVRLEAMLEVSCYTA